MSDNDDIEVESDADKRAHHNALERKRRDHIKDSFHSLRDSVPSLQGEKASRAQILDKATEYIQYMRRKNHTHQQDIDDLKRQNALLEQQGSLPTVRATPGVRYLNRALRSCRRMCHGKARADQVLCSWGIHFSSSLMEDASKRKFRALEKARSSAQLHTNYPSSDNSLYTNAKGGTISAFDGGSDSSSESEPEEPQSRKKLRMEAS